MIGVAGSPAKHSYSPKIHQQLFKIYNVHFGYKIYDVSKNEFINLVKNSSEMFLSVTMPYKELAYELSHKQDVYAKLVKNANTLLKTKSDLNTSSFNTDLPAIINILKKYTEKSNMKFYIFGDGSTARNVLEALNYFKISDLCVVSRKNNNLHESVFDYSTKSVILNTIPISGHNGLPLPKNCENFFVHDFSTYNPWPSDYAKMWQQKFGTLKNVYSGEELLIRQAIFQNNLFMKIFYPNTLLMKTEESYNYVMNILGEHNV